MDAADEVDQEFEGLEDLFLREGGGADTGGLWRRINRGLLGWEGGLRGVFGICEGRLT